VSGTGATGAVAGELGAGDVGGNCWA
jgi:hypothetical protein